MNVADSLRVASSLEQLGYETTPKPDTADVIVLNTCVVRQSAEDKAYGRLSSLKPLKQKNPELVINLMGCLVGVKGHERLAERFPFVDVFSPPSDPGPLVAHLSQDETRQMTQDETELRYAVMDEDLLLPLDTRGSAGCHARAGGAGLLARLHFLHHPLQTRGGAQPQRGRYRGRSALAGCPGRQGGHAAGADRGPLRH